MYGSFRSLYGSSSSGSGRSYVRESVSGFFITISNVAARTRACIVGEGVPAVAREEANKTRQQRTCNGTGDLTESSLTSRILLRPSIPQWCAAPGDEMQKRDDYVRGRSTWPVTVFPKAHASTPECRQRGIALRPSWYVTCMSGGECAWAKMKHERWMAFRGTGGNRIRIGGRTDDGARIAFISRHWCRIAGMGEFRANRYGVARTSERPIQAHPGARDGARRGEDRTG